MKKLLSRGRVFLLAALTTLSGSMLSGSQERDVNQSTQDRFLGAWRLAWLEEQAADGKVHKADCAGLLVYTRDGHMSVQVMYEIRRQEPRLGQCNMRKAVTRLPLATRSTNALTVTYHVEGALVRTLVGKDLIRLYELSGKQLIVNSSSPNEHWRVAWEHD